MTIRQLVGDCRAVLRTLDAESVQTCVSSPPYYGLRSYIADGDALKSLEIGLEPTPELFVSRLVDVFREVRRVLRPDGTLWCNLGDSYAGSGKGPSNSLQPDASQLNKGKRNGAQFANGQAPTAWISTPPGLKPKDLMMMPARLAMALQADGWYLRSMIPWLKRNSMPESVQDRPATSLEYVFLLSKQKTYFWDADAVRTTDKGKDNPRRNLEAWDPSGGVMTPHQGLRVAESRNGTGRNRRNSDWFFESWQGLMLDEHDDPLALVVNPMPFRGSHFATFPPKLVEPMVKASTSEKGQCPECGAPWVRQTEKEVHTSGTGRAHIAGGDATIGQGWEGTPRASLSVATVGWRASCAHAEAAPVPQTILDPFSGAGTVSLVADRLGRNAIGIDLKADYADMASSRIVGDSPMFVEFTA